MIQYWVIPPDNDVEFVANMEDVRETYEQRYDPKVPLSATKEHPKRVDYEYERAGMTKVFMFTEPLSGWRDVVIRTKKTKVDCAITMANLLENLYANCEKVIVVCDKLSTHTNGAFYKAFSPDHARSLARRIEFHYTPKHGSWLSIAENELSSLTRQCVTGRRIGNEKELREETSAWSADVNDTQCGVDWQMKIDAARIKLKSLYPKKGR